MQPLLYCIPNLKNICYSKTELQRGFTTLKSNPLKRLHNLHLTAAPTSYCIFYFNVDTPSSLWIKLTERSSYFKYRKFGIKFQIISQLGAENNSFPRSWFLLQSYSLGRSSGPIYLFSKLYSWFILFFKLMPTFSNGLLSPVNQIRCRGQISNYVYFISFGITSVAIIV